MAAVCAAAFAGGAAARLLGQPRAIGEIAAGIALGPSLLGGAFPGVFHELFRASVDGTLNTLARLGVILFVFFIGAELEDELLRLRVRQLGPLLGANLVLPVLAGVAVAFPLYVHLAQPGASHLAFALFVGVAAGTTALPVLAAILDDLGLAPTPLGRLALGTSAVTDVCAWSLLALVAAAAGHGGASTAAERIVGAAALAAAVLLWLRPLLRRAAAAVQPVLGVPLAIVLATATEHIGVSVVLGALLAGVAVGRPPPAQRRLFDGGRRVTRLLLLPVFFATTGLRIDLRSGWSAGLAIAGALVLLVAAAVKLAGVSAAARAAGSPWRDSFGLAFLLNTKGLTEIVVLRVGYDLGLLSRPAFGVLVVAALIATAATAPALQLLGLVPRRAPGPMPSIAASD